MHLLAGAAAKGSAEGCEPCPRCPHVRAPGQGDIEAPASMCCPDRPPADPKVVPARSPEDYPLCGPGEGQEVSTPDAAAGDFERLLDTLLESHGTAEVGLDFGDGSLRIACDVRCHGTVYHVLFRHGCFAVWTTPDASAEPESKEPN
jgi:hypothetical protein